MFWGGRAGTPLYVQADHKEKVQGCVEGRILSLAVYIEEAGSDLCPWEPLLCDCAPNVSLLSLLVLFNCDNKLSLKWVFFNLSLFLFLHAWEGALLSPPDSELIGPAWSSSWQASGLGSFFCALKKKKKADLQSRFRRWNWIS